MKRSDETMHRVRVVRIQLGALSSSLLARTHDATVEGDRYLIAMVQRLDRTAHHAKEHLSDWTSRCLGRLAGWRVPWRRRMGPSERVQRLLRDEARRMKSDVAEEAFFDFAEKIGLLSELVLSGSISVNDIAFEPAGPPEASNDLVASHDLPENAGETEATTCRADGTP